MKTSQHNLSKFMDIIKGGEYLILDTETTGLDSKAEIVQVGILSSRGDVLLECLVKPVYPIPASATAIHGIRGDHVANALSWQEVGPVVTKLLENQTVVIYNANYDMRLLEQSSQIACGHPFPRQCSVWCAMMAYAEHYGEWNDYRQDYKWQPLGAAALRYKSFLPDAHTAIADCRMTLAVCQGMLTDLEAGQE